MNCMVYDLYLSKAIKKHGELNKAVSGSQPPESNLFSNVRFRCFNFLDTRKVT